MSRTTIHMKYHSSSTKRRHEHFPFTQSVRWLIQTNGHIYFGVIYNLQTVHVQTRLRIIPTYQKEDYT